MHVKDKQLFVCLLIYKLGLSSNLQAWFVCICTLEQNTHTLSHMYAHECMQTHMNTQTHNYTHTHTHTHTVT